MMLINSQKQQTTRKLDQKISENVRKKIYVNIRNNKLMYICTV